MLGIFNARPFIITIYLKGGMFEDREIYILEIVSEGLIENFTRQFLICEYCVQEEPEGLKGASQMKAQGSADILGFSAQDIWNWVILCMR